MKEKDEKWALFWCKLLHPVIFGEIEKSRINRYLRGLCKEEYLFPDGKRKKPTLSTLRRKLNHYSQGGFKNLARKTRNDRGKIRAHSQEIIDKAIELKKEQPFRSDDTINRFLAVSYGKTIPKSTLFRHLKLAGATKLKLGITRKKVRKRWTREHTHDLWVGDFEEGPYVLYNDQVFPTYLCLFIDCHSRYVVEGRYYLRQSLDILVDSLLRAWALHGKSNELYVDNAKIYHANALKATCYSLTIKLLHRAKGDPSPGGLVERIFSTTQSQFESEVRAGDILTLQKLNRAFSAYLEVAYHQKIHSETGQTPQERYQTGLVVIRQVDLTVITQFFMKQLTRSVDPDFSDVRLNNNFYRVDPRLRGDKVLIRYDPFSDQKKVFIYSLHDQYLCQGILYKRDYGEQTSEPLRKPKPKNNYLELLIQQHNKQLNLQSRGIDYRQVVLQREWPFPAFAQRIAKLLGRKGGLGTFTAEEYEKLKKTYNRTRHINETILIKAWEKTNKKTLPQLIYQLQIINHEKEDQ